MEAETSLVVPPAIVDSSLQSARVAEENEMEDSEQDISELNLGPLPEVELNRPIFVLSMASLTDDDTSESSTPSPSFSSDPTSQAPLVAPTSSDVTTSEISVPLPTPATMPASTTESLVQDAKTSKSAVRRPRTSKSGSNTAEAAPVTYVQSEPNQASDPPSDASSRRSDRNAKKRVNYLAFGKGETSEAKKSKRKRRASAPPALKSTSKEPKNEDEPAPTTPTNKKGKRINWKERQTADGGRRSVRLLQLAEEKVAEPQDSLKANGKNQKARKEETKQSSKKRESKRDRKTDNKVKKSRKREEEEEKEDPEPSTPKSKKAKTTPSKSRATTTRRKAGSRLRREDQNQNRKRKRKEKAPEEEDEEKEAEKEDKEGTQTSGKESMETGTQDNEEEEEEEGNDGTNAYEEMRRKKIEENAAFMKALGLASNPLNILMPPPPPKTPRTPRPHKKQRLLESIPEGLLEARRSPRKKKRVNYAYLEEGKVPVGMTEGGDETKDDAETENSKDPDYAATVSLPLASWDGGDGEYLKFYNASGQRRQRRSNTSDEETQMLERVYQTNNRPPTDERTALAVRLGWTPRSVQIWFQNRRAKEAREHGVRRGRGRGRKSV